MIPRKSASWLLGGCLAVLVAAAPAFAQTGTITGQVTDQATGAPLAGAQVVVVGTNLGVPTNELGRYLIVGAPVGTQQVRVSLIGYAQSTMAVTVTAGETVVQDFQLVTSAIELEAVVVNAATGREQRARELGAKVSTLELERMNQAPIMSMADALSGRTEGVVMQDVNGTTGTAQRIRIRGANSISISNEPLVYVDGVLVTSASGNAFGVGGQEPSRLNDLNPNDIESIEIVKGPAASALYGTAAANGVLLITTKRGRPGATRWNAFVEMGRLDDITNYPDTYLSYQILDASAPLFTPDGLFNTDGYAYCPNRLAAQGECTQDGSMRFNTTKDPRTTMFSTGSRKRYGLSVRGGTEDIRYYVSGQLENEVGVIDYNTLDKANFRANLDARLSPTADLSVSFGYTDGDLGLNNNDNSIFSPIINTVLGKAYYVPQSPEDAEKGEQNRANYYFGFNKQDLATLVVHQDVDRYMTSASLRWRPRSWLTLNATGGLDLTSVHNFQTMQPDKLPISLEFALGFRESERMSMYAYTGTTSAVATFTPAEDLITTTTLGASFIREHWMSTLCYGSALVAGTSSCGTASAFFDVDEDFFDIRTIGAYLQQEFAWRDRVFLGLGVRGDDNSAFGADFGFIYYPSASLSWVIGEEEWFPRPDWLDGLRIRTAWGTSGLRPGFRDALTLYNPVVVATASNDEPGVSLTSTGNPDLKPEKTTEWEAGFEVGLLDGRIGIDFTYFHKRSENALIQRSLPGSLGLTETFWDNLGSIKNAGTELNARFTVLNRDNIGINLGVTNTTLDNEILELGEGVEDIVFNRGVQRHAEGYPAGAFFQPRVTYTDANGDGKLSLDEVEVGEDVVYIGPALPTWNRSIFADVRLFDWINVSTLIEGRGGNYQMNSTESFRCNTVANWGCAAIGDPNASLDEQAAYLATRFLGSNYGHIHKADFWRWRELSISLTAPRALAERFSRLAGLRLTLAGRNLALFTDYPGIDPEAVEAGGDSNFNQNEFNTQPPVRYMMIRLDYNF